MKRLFAIALCAGFFGPLSALAGPIMETIKCATIHAIVLDGGDADLKAIYKQIERRFWPEALFAKCPLLDALLT